MLRLRSLLLFPVLLGLAVSCSHHNPTADTDLNISGRIVTENGQKILDVLVSVQGPGTKRMGRVNENGEYRISGLSDGVYDLRPVGPGYTFSPDSIMVRVDGTDVSIEDINAVGKRSIYGKIIDVNGNAVSGVKISLSGGSQPLQTVTGEDGGYALPVLPDGMYRIVPEKKDLLFNRLGLDVEIRNHRQVAVNFTAFSPPNRNVDIRTFQGMEISRINSGVRTYPIPNAEALAALYKMKGMGWFAPTGVAAEKVDEHGIPLDLTPVQVCHTAFGYYKYYTESKWNGALYFFLNNANWLLEHHDSNYYLYYTVNKEHYPGSVQDIPWISAMAQGEALAVTSMAYHITGNRKYLDAAGGFFSTLYRNSGNFWCVGVDPEGYYWPEEYPNKDFCHVLNGMLFCLWGLWDYYAVSGDEFALTLFEAGIRSLADHYPYYRVNSWNQYYSRYCLHYDRSCGDVYHNIHLIQFQTFADFFHIPEFWDAYQLLLTK